ncbi:MAG: ParA family protein [Bacteroidota bacterium]
MRVFTVVNNKGGVGKTTTVQNLGAALAKKGARVLLIDLDAQASLTRSFGIRTQPAQPNSGDFLMAKSGLAEVVLNVAERISLVPAGSNLIAQEDSIKNSNVYPANLRFALQDSGAASSFDYVIADCPPALSALTRVALNACDLYFVPLQAEYLSYEGLKNFLGFSREIHRMAGCDLGGVFATRYNPRVRKNLSNDLISEATEQLGDYFLKTYIRDNIALSEAQAMNRSIFDYSPGSNGAKDYMALCDEILNRLKDKKA